MDPSNGWEAIAHRFITERSHIGASTVADWCRTLPDAAQVLDLGCGHGVPITEVLLAQGLSVWAIDASPTLVAAFQARFPGVPVQCEAAETSLYFSRQFDAVVAVGLMFLLPESTQRTLINRIAKALKPGGRLLFTAPHQAVSWQDVSTGRDSQSLGAAAYGEALSEAGLQRVASYRDEGGNHYFEACKGGDVIDA